MEENYRTPNGNVLTRDQLLTQYGEEKFQSFLNDGKITLVEDEDTAVTEEVFQGGDDIYITPNGNELTTSELVTQYGEEKFNSFVTENKIKKKEQGELGSQSEYSNGESEPTEQDYFEGGFGDVLRGFDAIVPLGLGDFIDDTARAVSAGYNQGTMSENAADVLFAGNMSTDEDLSSFIEANKRAQQLGSSAEMMDYQRIYEENGKGFLGVVLGIANNPSVVSELIVSSMVGMATNTDALVAAGSVAAGGAAIGASTAGAAGTFVVPGLGTAVGAAAGAISGAIASLPYAFAAAGTLLEFGATFAELLQEQVGEGVDLTPDNIRKVLNDEDAYTSIRNKALARGIAIGAIDAFTGKMGGKLAGKIVTKGGKQAIGDATKKQVLKGLAASSGVEAVGGSIGEASARGLIGQEMDVSEIALEGIAEMPGGVKNLIATRYTKPTYTVNKEKVDAATVDNLIETMTLEELVNTKIDIKNDFEGRQGKLQDKIVNLSTQREIASANPELNKPTLVEITRLQLELNKLDATKTEVGKAKAADIRDQIKDLQVNQLEEETSTSFVSGDVVEEEVVSSKTLSVEEEIETETTLNNRDKNISERSDDVKSQFGEQHKSDKLPYNKGKDGKGRAEIYDITKPDDKGVVTAEYASPEGVVDVIISGIDDNNFVGYTRVYENGEPTNMFTAKMESTGTAFKNMITSAEAKLPDNAEVVETTSISEGGLKVYNNSKLTEKLDEDGNVVTRPTPYSDATKESVKQDGQSAYTPFKTTDKAAAEAEVAKIEAAYPGINANIKERKGAPSPPPLPGQKAPKIPARKPQYTISIDLPVLIKANTETETNSQDIQDVKEIINNTDATQEGGQFQLDNNTVSSERKKKLQERATKLMEEVQPELSEKPLLVEASDVTPTPVVVTENKELESKVPKMKVADLENKKVNLVMADQLKVDENKMGGPFFPLIEKLFGKIAWASMDVEAATQIIKGSINGDYSVVYNMAPSAVDSNVVLLDSLIEKVKNSENSKEIFEAMMRDLSTKKFKGKTDFVNKIAQDSKTLEEFTKEFLKLDVNTKADILKAVLPLENVEASTEVGRLFAAEGITQESLRAENVEQFASDLPMGSMTMVLKVTDKNGNPITKDNISDAIVTREQQKEEGLPEHRNYPVYIRGKAVAMMEDTVPFWAINKSMLSTINAKIDGVIKMTTTKAERSKGAADTKPTTAKQARGAEMRRASMSAGTKFKATKATKTTYERFLSKLTKAFPNTEVVTSQKEFDELTSKLSAQTLMTKSQKVYGAVYNGKLYLNPALENYNTPVHEFGHLWTNTVKVLSPKTYEKGLALVKGTEYESDVRNSKSYNKIIKKMVAEGSTEAEIEAYVLEEALATAIGDKGESFATAAQKKNFKAWLEELFDFVKKLTGISNLTAEQIQDLSLEQFTEAVVVDLLSENKAFQEAESAVLSDALQLSTEEESSLVSGFERELQSDIQKVIDRRERNNGSVKNMIAKIDKMVRDSPIYNRLDDAGKKKLEDDARAQANAPKKRAPSRGRIVAAIDSVLQDFYTTTNIDTSSKLKIANKLIQLAKSAQKDLSAEIKAMRKKGVITTAQQAAVINRMSKVNFLNETSISSFVEYMSRVFANADYANTVAEANSKRKTGKKNASGGKLGVAQALAGDLQRIFSVNARVIPESVLENYMKLIGYFGNPQAVLELPNLQTLTMLTEDVINTLDAETSLVVNLKEVYNEYEKVLNEDGKVNYAATIESMKVAKVITAAEAELMMKYKSDIVPATEKKKLSEEEIQEQKEQAKRDIDFEIADYNPNNNDTQLPSRLEREDVKSLIKLARNNEALDGLSVSKLRNLAKVLDNINNGYFPSLGYQLKEDLQAVLDGKVESNAVERAKPRRLSMLYARVKALMTRKNAISELIRRSPLFNIDQLFGDYKTKDLFNSLFSKTATGVANYMSDLNVVQRKVERASSKVRRSKKIGNDGNKFTKSAYQQMVWAIQNEFLTNPGSKQVNSVDKWLKATIKRIDKGTSQFSLNDAEVLQGILNEYYNTETKEFDNDALYESFNKQEKASIETIAEINAGNTEKAVYTKAIIRGDKIVPLNNNVHINVLNATEGTDISSGPSFAGQINDAMRPSTRGGNLEGRTGLVTENGINFNIYDSALKGSKQTLMDFHMTSPIRTARKTMNQAEKNLEDKNGRVPTKQRDILNAINAAFEEATSNLLINAYSESSLGDAAMQYLKKTGYRTILAGSGRFVAELTSNASYAMIVDPQGFIVGTKVMRSITSEQGPQIARNLGWKNQGRLYADGLSGRMIDSDIINEAAGRQTKGTRSGAANFLNKYWNKTGQKYVKGVEFIADTMISTPDKLVMRPITFGSFDVEFKRITGKSPDYTKIAANDEAYMNANKAALEAASEYADKKSVFAGATDNAFMGILKGTSKPNQSVFIQGFNAFNNFMTRFLIYEYVTARTGIVNMVGRGDLSKREGAALLAGVTSRMMLYTLIGQYTSYALTSLFDFEDEEEDEEFDWNAPVNDMMDEGKDVSDLKSFDKILGQSFASAFTSMLLGRDFGNVTKSIINIGVEEFNKEQLGFLRDGDYDAFRDSIQYTVSPKSKDGGGTGLADYLMAMGAAFGPIIKTADLLIKKITEPVKKTEEARERQLKEIQQRIPLEILGNLGMIPMYKDVRKVVLNNIYKDLRQAKIDATNKKKIKEEMLQGYNSESDMKRYDRALWEDTYGPNSPGYDERQALKTLNAAERKLKQQMKDELYDYTAPIKNNNNRRSSSDRRSNSDRSSSDRRGNNRRGNNRR